MMDELEQRRRERVVGLRRSALVVAMKACSSVVNLIYASNDPLIMDDMARRLSVWAGLLAADAERLRKKAG